MNTSAPNWRGIPGIQFISNGSYSDPSLVYEGKEFNYWDIEDSLWEIFLEENPQYKDKDSGNPKVEARFTSYLKEAAKPYLDDVIAGSYFSEGKNSWRD